jgi:hypothetical protein
MSPEQYTLLTARQIEFWRELLAPFPREAYGTLRRGGRDLTYLKKQAIQNRLDSVVGPGGWSASYRVEEVRSEGIQTGGVICTLSVMVPDNGEGSWSYHTKEEGGGFEDMGRKDGSGEWIEDDDGEWKSGFTNAFRRAAGEFGFGRELYGSGVPFYLADLYGRGASRPVPPANGHAPANGHGNGNGYGPPTGQAPPQRQFNPLRPPTQPGKAAFAWLKKVGETFKVDALGSAVSYSRQQGRPERTDEWDQAHLNDVIQKTIDWCRSLETYGGQFEDEDDPTAPRAASAAQAPSAPAFGGTAQPAATPAQAPSPQGDANLVQLRNAIVAAVKVLVQKQTGRDATREEAAAAVGELAAGATNAAGMRGEVMDSLKGCTDGVWLRNILALANQKIQEAAMQTALPVDESPF